MGTSIEFWGVFSLLFLSAYLIEPRHVGIRFSRTPPVVARVNAPSKNATDDQRVISLPTGDTYQIPACVRGHFVMVFDWHVPIVIDGVEHKLIIPKLATTDFASIPRILHSLISPLNNTIYLRFCMITFTGILQTSSHAVYHAKLWIEFFTGACVLVVCGD